MTIHISIVIKSKPTLKTKIMVVINWNKIQMTVLPDELFHTSNTKTDLFQYRTILHEEFN